MQSYTNRAFTTWSCCTCLLQFKCLNPVQKISIFVLRTIKAVLILETVVLTLVPFTNQQYIQCFYNNFVLTLASTCEAVFIVSVWSRLSYNSHLQECPVFFCQCGCKAIKGN